MVSIFRNKKKLITDVELVLSPAKQMRGLMFRKRERNLLFVFPKERRVDLHMFFVFFPIDVVLLDEKQIVVSAKERFKPFRVWMPRKKAKYVLELPEGMVSKLKIKVGDRLGF